LVGQDKIEIPFVSWELSKTTSNADLEGGEMTI
jgi:hypothetical protein